MSLDKTNRFIEFTLGPEEFAIPLMMVKEVISIPNLTPVPNTSPHFLGIMNLRGTIVPVIDLRLKLKTKKLDGSKKEEATIIVDTGGHYIGVVVDSINKVLTCTQEDMSEMPAVESQVSIDFISGIYKKDKDLVVLLDVVKILDVKDRRELKDSVSKSLNESVDDTKLAA